MSLAPILQLPNVRNVPSPSHTTDGPGKNFLTEAEMTRLLQAAKQGRYGIRDHALLLLGYRHGLRVSELVGIRLDHLRLDEGRLWVKRLKGSLDTDQPMQGDTLRAVRQWLRDRQTMRGTHLPWLFISERGPMSRKAVNYLMAEAAKHAGVPVASVQETTIRGLTVESGEENEGLLPQMPQMKTPDSFRI